jgi:hypothetical protein
VCPVTELRSQGLKDGKKKKVVQSIERAHPGRAIKSATGAGASALHKIKKKPHTPKATPSSSSNSSSEESVCSMDGQAGIAAKAVVAVAEGPEGSKQELEGRRLYVPGLLYHIRREELRAEEMPLGPPVPAPPFVKGEEAPRNAKHKHHVVRGTDPSSRFGRIVLSSSMLLDHSCYPIRDGLLDAIEQLGKPGVPYLDDHK